MWNFRQFLLEVLDMDKLDTSHVQFVKEGKSLCYNFKLKGIDYKLAFTPITIYLHAKTSLELTNENKAYGIMFYGPNGPNPTGDNDNPVEVYNAVFAGIKKFVETYNPEGLQFHGAVRGQDLLYKRFVTRVLADGKTFIQINQENYLRKDVFDALDEKVKFAVTEEMRDWQGKEKQTFDRYRQMKNSMRQMVDALSQSGPVPILVSPKFYADSSFFGIVLNKNKNSLRFLTDMYGQIGVDERQIFDWPYGTKIMSLEAAYQTYPQDIRKLAIEVLKMNPHPPGLNVAVLAQFCDYNFGYVPRPGLLPDSNQV